MREEAEAGTFHLEKVVYSVKSLGESLHHSREEILSGLSVFRYQGLCSGLMVETVMLAMAGLLSPKFVAGLFQIEKVEDVFVYRSRRCRVVADGETEALCESCREVLDALDCRDAPTNVIVKQGGVHGYQ